MGNGKEVLSPAVPIVNGLFHTVAVTTENGCVQAVADLAHLQDSSSRWTCSVFLNTALNMQYSIFLNILSVKYMLQCIYIIIPLQYTEVN